jgi:putative acetyltransferase
MTAPDRIEPLIRPERADDTDAIFAVVAAAFGSDAEAHLVTAIRASPEYVADWALVADLDGVIVGHVMVSFAALDDGTERRRIAMLSPLAVRPDLHGRGVGSALVFDAIARVEAAGESLIILEGSPVYYARFGFEHAAPHGIELPLPSWAPSEAGQVVRLSNHTTTWRGRVEYPPAFDGVTEH